MEGGGALDKAIVSQHMGTSLAAFAVSLTIDHNFQVVQVSQSVYNAMTNVYHMTSSTVAILDCCQIGSEQTMWTLEVAINITQNNVLSMISYKWAIKRVM